MVKVECVAIYQDSLDLLLVKMPEEQKFLCKICAAGCYEVGEIQFLCSTTSYEWCRQYILHNYPTIRRLVQWELKDLP